MYRILKNGELLALTDKLDFCRPQPNGIPVLTDEDHAQGIVVNDSIFHLQYLPPWEGMETVSCEWFDGPAKLDAITAEGAALAQASADMPRATVGVLAGGFPVWKPGMVFEKQYSLFVYDGKVGFTRQPHITAVANQPPFSAGMESVYGVRPIPDDMGVYPYARNMAVSVGMRVREDSSVYECIQAADPLLYPPSQVPALFK